MKITLTHNTDELIITDEMLNSPALIELIPSLEGESIVLTVDELYLALKAFYERPRTKGFYS